MIVFTLIVDAIATNHALEATTVVVGPKVLLKDLVAVFELSIDEATLHGLKRLKLPRILVVIGPRNLKRLQCQPS